MRHGPRQRQLLVSQVFYPDEQATSQLLSQLARSWPMSQSLEVLAGFPICGGAPSTEEWHGVRIRRGGSRVDSKKSLGRRVWAYVCYCLWLLWRLLFCTRGAPELMVVSNPPIAPLIVWFCSLVRGWRFVVILHDVYPDGLVALGNLCASSVLARVWAALNRLALRRARRVIVLGRDMAALVVARYGVTTERALVVPNWSPVEWTSIPHPTATRLWQALQLEGKFVVQYSGNMGLWHDMETIVRAAAILRTHPEILFLMIGAGRRRASAERLAQELGLENIHWMPLQPQADLPDTLACCHVSLLSQRDGLEGLAVPSKLYGQLAAGRPIIVQAPEKSEAALVITEERCGLVIRPKDAQGLADGILRLAHAPAEAESMGQRARTAYCAKYTFSAALTRFARAIEEENCDT